MMSAASTSNPSYIVDVGEALPYRSHAIGPNFVTVKLSVKSKYNLWKIQMECLIKSQHMVGFIVGQSPSPAWNGKEKAGDKEAWIARDSLVKGWILGSLSEEAANKAVNHLIHMRKNPDFTAKDLWDELQRTYDPLFHEPAEEIKSPTTQAESESEVAKSPTTQAESESEVAKSPTSQAEDEIEVISESDDTDSLTEVSIEEAIRERKKKEADEAIRDWQTSGLYKIVLEGNTDIVIEELEKLHLNPWDKIASNGNTVLHVAVGSSTKNHELLKKLLEMTPPGILLRLTNSDGSTLLHIAAIGGNIEVVNMLVEKNSWLLLIKDNEGHVPLALSVSNMHFKTSKCLYELCRKKTKDITFSLPDSGEAIVVLAISCQDFSLAQMILIDYDAIFPYSEGVLTALAENFPRELNFWETRRRGFVPEFQRTLQPYEATYYTLAEYFDWPCGYQLFITCSILFAGFCAIKAVFYVFLRVLVRLFIEDTFQIHGDATSLLFNVLIRIFRKHNPSTHHQYYYNTSVFEATKRNSSSFIRCIIGVFPNAIWSTNEDGHNFIQYSVINRSEKVYNLLYEMSEHKNIYKTIKDSSGNNLLHLAARLAPTNKLNLVSGSALQLQRELQWFKEVERFVCPLNRIQRNLDDETPEMVFTREHKDLVIEGENWIKKTAESCTITAALITTIVFAAAIKVPGGNIQESGIPIFTNKIALKVFAISDAISLFTAVTSLLMFLSILTTRFAEQDFLFKLPRKLIIGLTMLFLSTTAMIIAFGATLFLVYGQRNLLMLIPIGGLTCLPITSFVTLQFPLIIELISVTYCRRRFVKEQYDYFY